MTFYKRKKQLILVISIFIVMLFIVLLLPVLRPHVNQLMNSTFIDKVNHEAIAANIKIIQEKYRSDGSVSFSAGASAVLIGHEGNKYYALTANHVVTELDDVKETKFIVLAYSDLAYADMLETGREYHGGLINYYQQFPQAAVEYFDEKYDLAIVSFTADQAYPTLTVSKETPKYGDLVIAMSNPHGKRNVITAGKICSKQPKKFGDEAGETQYPIVEHTAEISTGSSGSALLNEKCEIVDINLGGNENLLKQFISGKAMPGDRILDFLEEWKSD
ncbi:MAG: serine protease [Bacillota bacterium]